MDAENSSTGGKFSRRLFGYSRHEVDSHLDQGARAHQAACREIERLRAAEPLTRVGGDVAALISSFAETVGTMRDAAKRDADDVRKEADTYASATHEAADTYASATHEAADAYASSTREAADAYSAAQRSDADRQYESATLRARAESAAMLHAARTEIAGLAQQRQQIERALREAADGITNAMRSIGRVAGLAEPAMPRGPGPSVSPVDTTARPDRPTPPTEPPRPGRPASPADMAVRPGPPVPPVETPLGPVRTVPPGAVQPDGPAAAPGEPIRPVARGDHDADLVVESPGTSTVTHLTAKTL